MEDHHAKEGHINIAGGLQHGADVQRHALVGQHRQQRAAHKQAVAQDHAPIGVLCQQGLMLPQGGFFQQYLRHRRQKCTEQIKCHVGQLCLVHWPPSPSLSARTNSTMPTIITAAPINWRRVMLSPNSKKPSRIPHTTVMALLA